MLPEEFQTAILDWFQRHGRKNLPWQIDRTPYRVWVSEIMLQQTQVATVIPYFERFIGRLPTVSELANAKTDTVIELWAGLGYYARARNLHKAARIIQDKHGGELPRDLDALQELPGVGRSTAGAIVSLGFGGSAPILDGNVKRVLARYAGIEGWPGQPAVAKELWALSEALTPAVQAADYTQAMMDLGAMLCVARRPLCPVCPIAAGCIARRTHQVDVIPATRPRADLPERRRLMLVLREQNGAVFLEKRPPVGIWGGLWSFPEFEDEPALKQWLASRSLDAGTLERLPQRRHTFSHFHLDFVPVIATVDQRPQRLSEPDRECWVSGHEGIGMPGPILRLLREILESAVASDE